MLYEDAHFAQTCVQLLHVCVIVTIYFNCTSICCFLSFISLQWRTQEFVLGCTPKSLGSEYKHSTQSGFLIIARGTMRQW